MESSAARQKLAGKHAPLHRNRTDCCLVACRCHAVGESPQCDAPVKTIMQAQQRARDSVFCFCKTAHAYQRLTPAIL
jgi:hypothetical protein